MNKDDIFEKIKARSPNLNWVPDRTILLVRHGSHAYGTNTETSDEDFKGVCIPPKNYYLGFMSRFEQAEMKAPDPDCSIYEIQKFFRLAADCNPNCLEMLFVEPEDHLYVSELGKILIDNRDRFLSKKIKHTMTGYAISQLKRIKLHKSWLMDPPTKPPTRKDMGLPEETLIPKDQLMAANAEIQKELDKFQFNFMEDLSEAYKIEVRNTMSAMLSELKVTSEQHWQAAARKIGFDDNFIELMKKEREYSNAKLRWNQYQNWKATRNPKRAELEAKYGYDCKHAAQLARLLRSCREVLTTGKLIVKRPDREELLAIRNGAWTYEQLLEFAEKEDRELTELYNSTNILPKTPDIKYLDLLCEKLVVDSFAPLFRWFQPKKEIEGYTG